MFNSLRLRIVVAGVVLLTVVAPMQGPRADENKTASWDPLSLQLVRGIEAPGLAADVKLRKVATLTKAVREDLITASSKLRKALDLAESAGLPAADPEEFNLISTYLEQVRSSSASVQDLSATSAAQDVAAQELMRSLTTIDPTGADVVIEPLRQDAAALQRKANGLTDSLAEISFDISSQTAHVEAVLASPRDLMAVRAVLAAATSLSDSADALIAQQPGMSSLTSDSRRLADALAEVVNLYRLTPGGLALDSAVANFETTTQKLNQMSDVSGPVDALAFAVDGLRAMYPTIPRGIQVDYSAELKGASDALASAARGMESVSLLIFESEELLQKAKEHAPLLDSIDVGAPEEANAASMGRRMFTGTAVTGPADPLFQTLDTVTDMEVLASEAVPGLNQWADYSLDMYNGALSMVYFAVPPVAAAASTLGGPAATIQTQAHGTRRTLRQLAGTVTQAVEATLEGGSNNATLGGGCTVEVYDGVHIYTGHDDSASTCTGTPGPDIFWMRNFNDVAWGRGSHDQLHMGSGRDEAHGENGGDYAWGGTDTDKIWGGYGNDFLNDDHGQAGAMEDGDMLYGGPGSDDGDIRDGDVKDGYWMGRGQDLDPAYDSYPVWGPTGWQKQQDFIDKGE